jgi:hypothetical protein
VDGNHRSRARDTTSYSMTERTPSGEYTDVLSLQVPTWLCG